ncbi:hypothetical protein OG799_19965 [Micromonospora sp. NBC_00898]|uniref:hypothetical protein n=1 Tax=Micromonospora sp. NBC_00898 TaxID=2975981 RepID=UPI0038685B9F|nr:hypothetical protein OG799_19965 [Micromonospora sp. NBC_00898]
MNEITALRAYGPDAPPATAQALAAARARLVAECAGDPVRPGVIGSRPTARRRTLLVAAAAVVVAAGAGALVLPDNRPATAPPGSLSLVAVRIPEFPLTLRPRPAGLAAPRFSLDDGGFLAVYLARDGVSDVYLQVTDRPQTSHVGPVRPVTVAGRPGELEVSAEGSGVRSAAVSWERSPGQWVTVVGIGTRASAEAVTAIAATVVDQPQPVPLRVRLAPAGWTVAAFKDDQILTLRGATPDEILSVQVVANPEPDLRHQVMGAREERRVTVGGRDATLIRADDMWFLQAEVPDGAVVNIQAPLVLTVEQVVSIAEQVSVVRGR